MATSELELDAAGKVFWFRAGRETLAGEKSGVVGTVLDGGLVLGRKAG